MEEEGQRTKKPCVGLGLRLQRSGLTFVRAWSTVLSRSWTEETAPGTGVKSQFLKEISGRLHLLPARHSRKGFEMGREPRDPTGSHDCVNPLGKRLREMSKA